jgi:hypothetical protein
LGLAFLVAISYLPALLEHLSINPLYLDSGLTTQSRPGLTSGFPFIDPNVGTTTQSLGHLCADDWLHGRIPWWDSYAGVGLPLAAEMQSEAFFLPFVLLLHFSAGVIYLRIALQLVAGISTLLLLRKLDLHPAAAFIGAVFYMFNGTFAWFGHGMIMPLAFLPLFLLGIEQAVESTRQNKRGGWALISVAIAFSIYAGFPETAFMDGLLALLWFLVRLGTLPGKTPDRLVLLAKVCLGGLAGLLVTAPLVIPFFEYLQHSAVAHNNFADAGLPKSGLLQLFLPYIYGPIEGFTGLDHTRDLGIIWGNTGGYFGITLIFLALLGIIAGPRYRALRVALGLWTLVLVARTINVPPTNALFSLIPGMNLIAVYRNSSGTFELAAAILAAFAVDRWLQPERLERSRVLLAFAVTALLTGIGSYYGAGILKGLFHASESYPDWLAASLGTAVFLLTASATLCVLSPSRRSLQVLTFLICAECAGLYVLPHLAGLRHVAMDVEPVKYLNDHLGWQRAYALGGIHPDYGSYYQTRFIDHESLPVSDAWVNYVRTHLDPDIDAVTFSGDYPAPFSEREQNLRRNLKGFEELGVRYVAVPRPNHPFEERTVLPHAPSGNVPIYLTPGKIIAGTLPTPPASIASIQIAGIDVGTEGGLANGQLHLQLCSGTTCVEGQAELTQADDNADVAIPLNAPLTIRSSAPLRYSLSQLNDTHPVAIWMYPGAQSGQTPDFSIIQPQADPQAWKVFQTQNLAIYELAHPAPYLEATNCRLTIQTHETLQAECTSASKLIRRELYYPGWQATINGKVAKVGATSIFQSLDLPQGSTRIAFRYVPTNLAPACVALLIGLLLTGVGFRRWIV